MTINRTNCSYQSIPRYTERGTEGYLAAAGRPARSRKKGFRAPDVRTIFSPGERDPRVKEESGEGHTFEPGGEDTWCDVCWRGNDMQQVVIKPAVARTEPLYMGRTLYQGSYPGSPF
uniref:Uncharacterized protein n=1 Tax=Sander lucioperca TaxID=283035 RepID=A0A8C9YX39_SANLU